MKATVNREELLKALDIAARGIGSKVIINAWESFHMRIKGDECFIHARSTEIQIKSYVKLKADEDFKICVPGKIFHETIRLLDTEDVIITSTVKGKSYTTTITIKGSRKKYNISSYNPDDFSTYRIDKEKFKGLTINGDVFIRSIGKVTSVIDPKDLREQISGVSVHMYDGNLEITGSRNAIIGRMKMNIQQEIPSIIIPRRVAEVVESLGAPKEVKFGTDGKHVVFKMKNVTVTGTLINAKVPQVQKFWGELNESQFILVDRIEMINSMKRLNMYSSDEANTLKFEIKKKSIVLSAENDGKLNSASEEINVENENVPEYTTGFNPKYIMDVLSKMDSDTIRIHLKDKTITAFFYEHDNNTSTKQMWLIAPLIVE